MSAFEKAWSIVKMMDCPVCRVGQLRMMDDSSTDFYCDNCESSWGIQYIGGMPTGTTPRARSNRVDAHVQRYKRGD
tara:strand:+ start:3083 stop:3310 length:228 start_codon:yes stop_codon:yes gene_type:complete